MRVVRERAALKHNKVGLDDLTIRLVGLRDDNVCLELPMKWLL